MHRCGVFCFWYRAIFMIDSGGCCRVSDQLWCGCKSEQQKRLDVNNYSFFSLLCLMSAIVSYIFFSLATWFLHFRSMLRFGGVYNYLFYGIFMSNCTLVRRFNFLKSNRPSSKPKTVLNHRLTKKVETMSCSKNICYDFEIFNLVLVLC